MDRYAIILAAGKGTRMKSLRSDISKVSFPILKTPLVRYVLMALEPLQCKKIVTVVGFGGETSSAIVQDVSEIVWQKEQKGTGHAVMQVAPILESLEGETIVCCGDTPLLRADTLSDFFAAHEKSGHDMTAMTSVLADPSGYGRIKKENGQVIGIVEQKDCTEEEKTINEVNAGVYIFNNKALFEALKKLTTKNAAGEYYLTDVLSIFVKEGRSVGSYQVADVDETLGVNDRYQLSIAAKILQERINKAHMLAGVTIVDPASTYIAPGVEIGADTVIYPNTFIYGHSKIGTNNVLGPSDYLENVSIGDDNEIIYSHLVDTVVHSKTTLGPYLRTRKNAEIMDKAHIGNFNELKNVSFGEGSKAAHLSYMGDATIAGGVNIGCGTIIANYDGVNKWHSDIGEGSFIGSGSTIISPVNIAANAFIAAGSTINHDVPGDAMAIARARQENKAGYSVVLHEKALEKKAHKK